MSELGPFPFDWLLAHGASKPEAPAIGTPQGWATYGELLGAMVTSAQGFAEAGVAPGDFVLFLLPPGPAAVAGVLAAQSLGACAVEINREGGERGLMEILQQTEARHVVVEARDARRFAACLAAADLRRLHVVAKPAQAAALEATLGEIPWTLIPPAAKSGAGERELPTPHRDLDAAALLAYTSGSTGVPRGIIQSHRNVDANTGAIAKALGLGADDRALSILPLFYCFGRSVLQTHLLVGGSVFFDHRFVYPQVVMAELGRQACTGFYGVPLTFELLRRQVDVGALDPEALRYVAQAGGAMRRETIRWVREVFAPAALYIMYGQTEATARLSILPPEKAEEKEGSIGRGLDNLELRIVDEAGEELPPTALGEVIARGPSIASGYYGAPEETAEVFRDGWLWTGDLGWRDEEGFIYLTGRAKEVLKLGGHRVAAAEIEGVLLDHPLIAEAAVVGSRDELGDEIAIAFVASSEWETLQPEAIRAFCRRSLPLFKVPAEVRLLDELPKTASGKISKDSLRKDVVRDGPILKRRAAVGSGKEGG